MKVFSVLASSVSLASAMCHYGTNLMPRDVGLERRADGDFGYDELHSALEWHSMSPNNTICAMGKNQSPVNIKTGKYDVADGASYKFDIVNYPHGAEFLNTGHNVQVFANGSAEFDGTKYSLAQYHFHTPSEHRIGDEYYPSEVHFVFQNGSTRPCCYWFMIEIAGSGDHINQPISKSLAKVLQIPSVGDKVTTAALNFGALEQHIRKSDVYHYSGSLTTPPCDEGVKFNVVANPVYIDVKTFRNTKKVVKFNSRYTQNAPGEVNLLDYARIVLDKS
ncbi:carbonate dehydratase [Emericellopsis atlantica]|uniref:Carbonic anhydrase n=1 Tax=Emericellopsis atlantica TaxID=2614577 RepID=A0A9P7ZTB4_9HYPO|nr:carbonate dehydratase [Emericellopsis atlantica]KAG9257300.1 carbonate dehydratase [Emericellopsis atlantica]